MNNHARVNNVDSLGYLDSRTCSPGSHRALPETPVRRTNAFKPRQHLRHLAAILGLTLCTICALPAHANDIPGITVTETGGTTVTTEAGGSDTFIVVLDTQPKAAVTIGVTSSDGSEGRVSPAQLVFTTGNWDAAQIVTVTGVDDRLEDGDRSYNVVLAAATSTDANYNGVDPNDIAVINVDDDTVGVTVSTNSVLVTEATGAGRTVTYTVVLKTSPTNTVTITPTSGDSNVATVSAPLTFTIIDWHLPQIVTVTGIHDDIDTGDRTTTITHRASGGGYDSVRIASVGVTLTDDDTAGVTVSKSRVTVTEASGSGHTATYRVGLQSQPTGTVTLTPTSGANSVATVSPASLTFTTGNWKTAQQVTVTGVDDRINTDRRTTITHKAAGGGYDSVSIADVTVTLIDNDKAGVTVSESRVTTTEASGARRTATFTVVLDTPPSVDVSIAVTSSDPSEGMVDKSRLVFTTGNWDTAQTVTVTGVNDRIEDGDQSYTIVLAAAVSADAGYRGIDPKDIRVTNVDDDKGPGLILSKSKLETSEGGQQELLSMRLTRRPTAAVTIAVTSSDTTEGRVAPASLTFTPAGWGEQKVLVVTGEDDDLDDGDQSYTIRLGPAVSADMHYRGFAAAVPATNKDDDAVEVRVSGGGRVMTTEGGGSGRFRVALGSRPIAAVTIAVTSSDPGEGRVAPASLTFTSGDWDQPQEVTVTGEDDVLADRDQDYTIRLGPAVSADVNYNGLDPADIPATNTDNDVAEVTVSVSSVTTTEGGGRGRFRVALGSQPSATVTIAVTSSDPSEGTVDKSRLVFTSGNWDTAQTVTVTGKDDDRADGDRRYTIRLAAAVSADVNYNGFDPADVLAINTDDDDVGVTASPGAITVTEARGSGHTATYRVVLQSQPSGNVTVTPVSGDDSVATVSPASLTFTSSNWKTPQIVTVTGVDDSTDTDRSTSITHRASGGGYGSVSGADVAVTLIDDDGAGVTLSESAVTVDEDGGTATYRVVLDSRPSGRVTITPRSGDINVAMVSAPLTFTADNWDTAQTVTVTGVDDDFDTDRTTSITHTVSGGGYDPVRIANVAVSLRDDDVAGVTISTSSVTVTKAGRTATYTIVLTSKPTGGGSVRVTPRSRNPNVATPSGSLTFTPSNWDQPQKVTVTGVDDRTDAKRATTITHAAAGGGYNSVRIADVTVTLIDDNTAGVTISKSRVTVTEARGSGHTATYRVVLQSQPSGAVTITPASGDTDVATVSTAAAANTLTFTTGNWKTAQTVTVTGVDDETDAERSTTISHAITGGGYDSVRIASVSVTLIDNDGAGVTVSETGVTVTETGGTTVTTEAGGSDTFIVVLDTQPKAAVTIGVTSSDGSEGRVSPAQLVFTTGNWDAAQIVTVTGVDDRLEDGDRSYNVVLAAATSTDANYNGVDPNDIAVINVDDDTVGVTVSTNSVLVTEATGAGRTVTYTVVLKTSPTNTVTITPTSGDSNVATVSAPLTFTIIDWHLPQIVTVTGIHDDIDTGDRTTTITHRASGGGYDSVRIASVGVTLTDDDTAGVTVSKSRVTVTEASGSGHTATYRVGLQSQPTGTVTLTPTSGANSVATVSPASLTFTTGNWKTAQQVTVTGVDDRINTDRRTTITHKAAGGGYDSVSIADVTVTLIDNDKAGVTVSESRVTTTEASGARRTATFTVVLDTPPSVDVSIAVTSSDPSEGMVDKSRLVFTTGNWDTAQTVTVTGVNDRIEDGDQSYTIVLAAAVSADAGYRGIDPKDIRVTNVDDDKGPGLILSKSKLETSEGGQQELLSMRLTRRPTAAVTIAVTSSDTTEGRVAPASLTFTPAGWGEQKVLVVTGEDDDLDDGDQSYTIRLGPAVSADMHYRGFAAAVPATNKDDDAVEVRVSGGGRVMTTEGGGSGRFRVALGSRPIAAVTIAVTSSDPGEGRVAPASLTFTSGDWDQPQEVTVTGEDDVLADRDQDYTIRLGPAVSADVNYNGLDPADIPATNTDNDVAEVTVSVSSVTTTEGGGRGRFRVALGSQPSATVTIAVTSSDPSEGTVDKSRLVFTSGNWDTAQTVTVTGKDDDRADGDRRYTIRLAAAVSADVNYNGFDPADVLAINTDDDDVGVTASPGAITVTEARGSGHTATYRVVLQSQPSGNVTVTPVSGDDSVATVSPASLTFTSSNWKTPQIVTVTGVDDSTDTDRSTSITHRASGGGYGSVSGADVAVTLIDDDGAGVTLSESAVTVDEDGGTATYRVVLDSRPSGRVTITPRSGDINVAMVSAPLTFTADNWDTAQTVTVTGVDDDFDTDRTTSITHTVSGGGYDPVRIANVAVSLRDDDVAGVTISTSSVTVTKAGRTATYTIVLTSKPTGGGSVRVTPRSRNPNVATPSGSLTFTPSNWDQPQKVTVTGVDDRTDAKRATTITHAAAGGGYNSVRIASVRVTLTDDDNSAPTGTVTITGTATQGQTLIAVTSAISDPDGPSSLTFSYQWKRDGTAISGATSGTYILKQADVGAIITVTVSWTDAGGTAESLTSAATTTVTATSSAVTATSSAVTAPAAPVGLKVIARSGKVKFRWTNPNNLAITHYEYKQWTGNTEPAGGWKDFTGAMSATTQSRSVRRLTDGTEYNFRIRAVATGNVTGAPSDVITVTPGPTPTAPGNRPVVTAVPVPGDRQITLSWNNPNNADIIKYQIRRRGVPIAHVGTKPDWNGWSDIPGSDKDTISHTVTGLPTGVKYYFRIRAVAGDYAHGPAAHGPASSVIGVKLVAAPSAAPAAPPGPTSLTAVADSGQVTLTWDHPKNPAITGYQYKYWSGSPESGRWTDMPGSNADTTNSPPVTGLTNGTKYHFRIRAMIGRIAGVKSRSASATPATPPVQKASTQISAHARYRQVELIWRDPTLTDQRDTTITKYQIKYWSGNSETGDWRDISATINTRHVYYLVTGLTNNTTYSFRIRGLTNGFITTESNLVQATPLAGPPRSPARPQAVAGDSEVTLTWNNPNNPDITRYQILQWTGGGERGSWGDWRDIPGSDKDTTDYTVPGLTNGVKYSFRIRAVAGSVTGSRSPYTAVVIPAAPVVVPGSITVAVRDSVGDSIAISLGIVHTGTRTVDSVVPTTEDGGSYSFTVVLDTQPSANVSIAVSSSDTTEGTVDKNSLVFTTTNWNTPQTVTVTGQADTLTDGDQDYTIILAAAVSTDTNYHGIDPIDIAITNTDTDTATRGTRSVTMGGFTVIGADPGSLGVDGDKINARVTGVGIQLALPSEHRVTRAAFSRPTPEQLPPPQAGVTFGAAPAYVNVELAPPLPASSPATVCLQRPAGMSDNAAVYHLADQGSEWEELAVPGNQQRLPGYICGSMRSGSPVVVGTRTVEGATHSRDDDTAGVTLSTTSVTLTEAFGAGRTATYSVKLNTRPSGDVTVTPVSSDTSVAKVHGNVTALTFTPANWADPQIVTVGVVDDRTDADRTTTITHTVTGGGYDSVRIPDVAVILVDDDTVDALLFGFAGDTLKVTEADGAMHRNYYQIVLKSQPSGDVTVTPTSGDTGIATITPSSLTFTADNWAESQSIAVTGVDDHVDAGDRSTAITHSASGGGYDSVRIPDVVVTLIDDDVAGVTVSETDGSTATTESGGSDSISVVLDSQPTAEVTLAVTSSDTTEGTVDKSSLVFTPHNWATAQSITVTGVDDRLDDGEQSYKIELGIAASNDSNYNGINPDDVVVTSKVKVSVEITGVAPGTTKIEGNTITTQVDGTDVQLTLPAGHDVTEVAFSVPRSGPSAQAGVTFGDEPAYVGIRIDAQLPSSSSASVCLEEPAGLSGTLFVYHLTDGANTWEKLLPALAAPNGYVCGKTKDFSVFVVGSPMPVFGSAFVDDYVWTVGEAVDVELPAATGGDGPITYRLSPALPAGLEFEAPVRTITGTPNEVFATTEFTYTARDTDGHTGQLQFRVTVQAAEVKERSRALAVALASFGRTVAGEAVDVIGRRFIAAPVARSGITLGGTALSSVGSGSASAVLSLAEARGESGATVDGLNPGLITWRGVSARELFSRSDFVLPLQGTKEDRVRTGWTFWGQGSAGRFSSEAKAIETDGELHTGYMGLDYRFGSNHNALAGVAFSHSAGEVDYAVAGDFLLVNGERGGITGEVDLAMTSVLPYVHYTPRLGLGIWGLAGAGSGEVKLKDQGGRVETDVRMVMAAVGVRQRLKTWRGVDFAVKSDVLAVQLKTDAAAGLEAVTGDARRARLALEMGAERVLSPDALLRPDIEFSGRWDEGDADNGIGVEISGGVAYVQSRLGLRLGVRGRYLLAHEESEFADWGGSFALQIGEGLGGHGLWLSYEPQWGAPASGVEQLWDSEGIREVGGAGRMKFDLGYGMTTRGRGWLVTPYGGVLTTDQDTRYRLGAQAEVDKSMDISLEGVRRENAEGATEHGIFLRWKILL